MTDKISIKSDKSGGKKTIEKMKWKRKIRKPSTSESRSETNLTSVSKQDCDITERSDTDRIIQWCAPCLREERNVESSGFCDNCQENLCPACVRQHSKFATMKDHVIHGKHGETVPVVPIKIAKCEKHNGKPLDMYCSDHDAVHCAACIALNHRKCKQVSYLPEVAKDISESQEYKDVIESITRTKTELETTRSRRIEDNRRLVKEKEDAIARIKYVRKEIDRCLDNLEKKTLDKLEDEYKKYNKVVDEDVAVCDDLIVKLDELARQLKEDLQLDDANRFIQMRRATQVVKTGETTVEVQAKSKGTEQIQFLPDSQINDILGGLPGLGSFASEQKLLKGTLIGQFDAHLAADTNDCQLLGSDFLPDGKVLVTDWENKTLKLLNTSYKVVDYLKLSGSPYSACSISQNEGTVSITNKKVLQFFTIDPRSKMYQGRVIKTTEFCRDVAYNNGKIYVICGDLKDNGNNQISVYSLDGHFIQNIFTDSAGNKLFAQPLYLALNSIGNIYVGDEEKGVISLDKNGEVISIFKESKVLRYIYGVAIVNNDQLFVCGFGSHNVVQIGRNIVLLGEVLSENAGLRNPRSVCYDVNSQRMLVTCKNTNFVRVYSLT